MIYKKYRELSINFFDIDFKNIKLEKIISYPPAGNDVVEAIVLYKGTKKNVIIKYERSKMAFFDTENYHLNILKDFLVEVPKVIEFGKYNDKNYIVLEKKCGSRLSEIFSNSIENKEILLKEYGRSLSKIHSIKNSRFLKALQRPINDYPKDYKNYDDYSKKIIKWLIEHNIENDFNTFIQGDFHYANVLFADNKVSGIIDLEYSGMGFKEQDIAWACVLRPGQKFMDNFTDIKNFIEGYKFVNTFNFNKFKWCYINSSIHFYLMNIENEEYKNNLRILLDTIIKEDFDINEY